MPDRISSTPTSMVNVARVTAATGVTLAVLFFLCWIFAAASDLRFPHMFVELFTTAPVQSGAALGEGLLWSFVGGAIVGVLESIFYNLFAILGRR